MSTMRKKMTVRSLSGLPCDLSRGLGPKRASALVLFLLLSLTQALLGPLTSTLWGTESDGPEDVQTAFSDADDGPLEASPPPLATSRVGGPVEGLSCGANHWHLVRPLMARRFVMPLRVLTAIWDLSPIPRAPLTMAPSTSSLRQPHLFALASVNQPLRC